MSESTGVIHDIGYQRYSGPRLGRGPVFGALYLHGLRTVFGFGRSAKAKIFPWLVVGIVTVVAAGITAIRSQLGQVVLTYAQFADVMSWLIIFFVAVAAPELVSRDLRSGVLPLYFSRPLARSDYPLAKLLSLVTALWLLLGGPQLVMFLGAAFITEEGLRGVWNELLDLLPGLLYAGLWAAVFGSIGLLVASLTGKRAFAAGGIVAVFLMTTPIVGILSILPSQAINELAFLASPMTLVQGVGTWALDDLLFEQGGGLPIGGFGPVYALAAVLLLTGCVVLLLARYGKVATR
ncbi:ABC transporter permease [Salinispora arenicola]|uniref:ABC-2 type transport system permease protein n=2 Tax=Salinispora arenicola TaxID=168697 RepID=A0A542XMY2_SALAC|nr:ABC transporter permease subunit [Salinispora arenicola]MCN0177610.1 ABC transporter permease [Salinispora arenicola]NIL39900.1 ABC transporter permease [Salinispora arenicola]NIL56611.1 ABC transporter permease [Salinispora arenicola]NIL61614.1 ABC transporter permease [Salinispora arenicola]TQL37162.1 ABC-2 type transport system permease protein [Salinispora arenicola]